ncbi:MAG: protein kinase [Myxococcales bacterium]|nr:protein kinase [Myxococcales bacterium]
MKACPVCGLQYQDEHERCFVDDAVLEPMSDPWIGKTLAGRYLVEQPIGEGGMATVYRARHTLVDRPVAVKIMSPRLARDQSLRERFRREAKNAAALAHPNIIEIYDYGETDDGAVFLVMELLSGAPLADHISRGALDPGRVASLGLQIAQGLARAHDFEVIHRDLKPENIFVSQAGPRELVKLLDFGIARSMHDSRLTNAGEIFGTPQYMAPERITSIDAGPAADLYALGCILFEMLTGRLPFESQELTGFFIAHMQQPPPRPSELAPQCPRRLEELILKLLAKKPEERPVDAHAVIKELQALVPASGPVVAPPVATPSRPIAAPTLPPTTLERWARRTAIFEQMLLQAYPDGSPPEDLRRLLDGIRGALRRVHEIRSEGLKVQRHLEELEREARDNRARLGFAVQSLAEDLSLAREAVRQAKQEVQPYFDADDQARAAYAQGQAKLAQLGGYRVLEAPDEAFAKTLHELADALDRWGLSRGAAEKARRWVESKEQEVADLELQVRTLRGNLERTENEYLGKKESSEAALSQGSGEAQEREQALIQMATDLCDRLRGQRVLRELFVRLEQES